MFSKLALCIEDGLTSFTHLTGQKFSSACFTHVHVHTWAVKSCRDLCVQVVMH